MQNHKLKFHSCCFFKFSNFCKISRAPAISLHSDNKFPSCFKNIEISFIKPKFPLRKWILDTVTCLECPRVCQRSVYRDNPDVSDVDDSTHGLDYFCVAVYIPFLDTILERFRFNEKTTFAGLFDTLLPAYCAKNGAVVEEFMQLYGNNSQFLHANNVMPHDTSGMHECLSAVPIVGC